MVNAAAGGMYKNQTDFTEVNPSVRVNALLPHAPKARCPTGVRMGRVVR